MVSAANNYRGVPGLSPLPAVTISKDCGPFQPALGQVVEMGNGWYALLGHVQDRNTLGALTVHGSVADSSVQCIDPTYPIVSYDPYGSTGNESSDLSLLVGAVQTGLSYLKTLTNASVPKQDQIP